MEIIGWILMGMLGIAALGIAIAFFPIWFPVWLILAAVDTGNTTLIVASFFVGPTISAMILLWLQGAHKTGDE